MKVIDLSIALEQGDNPVYPGTTFLKLIPVIDYTRNMLLSNNVEIWLHAGTHVDAPVHVFEGGSSIESISLDKLVREAVILDLTKIAADENHAISAEDLNRAEKELKESGESIRTGDVVILRTDRSLARPPWTSEYRNGAPYITQESADWLVAKKPSAVGFDFPEERITNLFAPRVEPNTEASAIYPLPLHRRLLGSGIYLVEHLTNLNKFGSRRRFLFVAAPLKINGAEGTPVRALGIEFLD